jgi:hypothetical protein
MTAIAVPYDDANRLIPILIEAGLPEPLHLVDPSDGNNLLWEPDLTAAQLATVQHLVLLARSGLSISAADFDAIRADLQLLRDLRQLGRNPFMALTAAERDRMTYDALVSVTRIFLAILREGNP